MSGGVRAFTGTCEGQHGQKARREDGPNAEARSCRRCAAEMRALKCKA
jgi:hypothetical protein